MRAPRPYVLRKQGPARREPCCLPRAVRNRSGCRRPGRSCVERSSADSASSSGPSGARRPASRLATEVKADIVIRSGDPFPSARLHAKSAEDQIRSGDLRRALTGILEAGFRTVERTPNAWLLWQLWISQCAADFRGGSVADALRSSRRARDAAKIAGYERGRCSALANIAYLRSGQVT